MSHGSAFAPSNIALIKYWGKRDTTLNLPLTNSLSISLAGRGTHTRIELNEQADRLCLNGQWLEPRTNELKRVSRFLDINRPNANTFYTVQSDNNIPLAAGLASSASGFAALTLALNKLHGWKRSNTELSALARQGSGSACRSVYSGFVEWEHGNHADGHDSVATPIDIHWPEFRIGLLIFTEQAKAIGSREAMQRTVDTSSLYQNWPEQVATDLAELKGALETKDFPTLGTIAERNALAMHATMLDSTPPIDYCLPETRTARSKVQLLRQQGVDVFFTQDAGPNLKLLFLEKDQVAVEEAFDTLQVVRPFAENVETGR